MYSSGSINFVVSEKKQFRNLLLGLYGLVYGV